MAGGFKQFGPTYKSTDIVRLGYEGILNGQHDISAQLVEDARSKMPGTSVADATTLEDVEPNVELAGKFAAILPDGVGLAGDKGANAVGLFREDLHDMVNASFKASFYFGRGEYYVQIGRTSIDIATAKVGDFVTSDADGKIRVVAADETDAVKLGVITHLGSYPAGNMYLYAGDAANGGTYVGIILYI